MVLVWLCWKRSVQSWGFGNLPEILVSSLLCASPRRCNRREFSWVMPSFLGVPGCFPNLFVKQPPPFVLAAPEKCI